MRQFMKRPLAALLPVVALACAAAATPRAAHAQSGARPDTIDWRAVDAALGRTGSMQAGGVYRYGMPRIDLQVTSQGVRVLPSLALGSWLAFRQSGPGEAVAMGDLVLTQDELNPVLRQLQLGGVGQTAIHKHLLQESPAIWWTHVHARGDPVRIAGAVRAALALTGTPAESPGAPPPDLALDTAGIRSNLGHGGRNNGGVYNVAVPRVETIRAMGIEVPPGMGMATVINFQPTSGGRAVINGDFVMTAGEVDSVIAALRENDIQVVSLHNHLMDEEPRLFFMHFWAHDDALRLARGLRAALDRTNSQRGGR